VSRVPGRFVVGANKNAAAGDCDISIALRTELGHPLEILGAGTIHLIAAGLELDFPGLAFGEMIGQTFRRRIHIAGGCASPLRPILGVDRKTPHDQNGQNRRRVRTQMSDKTGFHFLNLLLNGVGSDLIGYDLDIINIYFHILRREPK